MKTTEKTKKFAVLILVLVDNALGDLQPTWWWITNRVLILVLVDNALGVNKKQIENTQFVVLILVLVDNALGENLNAVNAAYFSGLNPCFSG